MNFTSHRDANGVLERESELLGSRGPIPVVVWSPSERLAEHVVLVGHGAAGDKREDYVVAFADYLVRRHSAAVVSIDGPVHGRRREYLGLGSSQPFLDFVAAWSSDDAMTDDMISDWTTTLDAVLQSDMTVPYAKVAYWGLSMGTILGLPFVAQEPRIAACVLGLMGATGPTHDRITRDARRLRIPTMFLMQWHDQFFPREVALTLFDELGSDIKTLVANPGVHGGVPPRAFDASARFLFEHLA